MKIVIISNIFKTFFSSQCEDTIESSAESTKTSSEVTTSETLKIFQDETTESPNEEDKQVSSSASQYIFEL